MKPIYIEVDVSGQIISRLDKTRVVEKSRNYLYVTFSFSEDWNGLTKTAIFTDSKGKAWLQILDDNDCCKIPWEVIEYPSLSISVFGGDRITANKIYVDIEKSGYIEGETPSEPSPDVYEQILTSIKPPYVGENGNWYIWDIEAKEYVDSGESSKGGVGRVYYVDTSPMGVIFGDYENNKAISKNAVAFGNGTFAGCKCYYYHSIEGLNTNKPVITLQKVQERLNTEPESFETGWEVGDIISMVNGSKYWECAEITAVNGNKITVTKLPFTKVEDAPEDLGYDDYAIFVPAKPEMGTGDVGGSALVFGVENKGLGRGSFTGGRDNETQAQYGFNIGRRNKLTGYCGFVAGQGNIVDADTGAALGAGNKVKAAKGFVIGTGNILDGANSFIGGDGNEIYARDAFAFGYRNIINAQRGVIFGVANEILEHGTKGFIVGENNKVEGISGFIVGSGNEIHYFGTNGFIVGAENRVVNPNGVAIGRGNITYRENGFTFGQFADTKATDNFILVIGNGSDWDNKSNAYTLDEFGNAWYAGKVYIGGASSNTEEDNRAVTNKELKELRDLLYTTKSYNQSFEALTEAPEGWIIEGNGYTLSDAGIIPGHASTQGDTKVSKKEKFIAGDEDYTFTVKMSHYSGTQYIHWGADTQVDASKRGSGVSGYTFTAGTKDYKTGVYSLYKNGNLIASFTDKNTNYGYQNIRTYKFTVTSTGIIVNGPFIYEDGSTTMFIPDNDPIKEGYVGAVTLCNNANNTKTKLTSMGILFSIDERLESIESRIAVIEEKINQM